MKIKESQLKNMIAKAINEAVDESRFDYLGSGMDAYQGTGSKESDERVKKIRSKWPKYHDTESGPTIEAPAGKYDKNKTTYDNAKQSYGGLDAKDSYEDNVQDIGEFEVWMDSLGIAFEKSYASPRGMYCVNLGRALKDKGYRHTRDFGYYVDDYPCFPADGSPLQIPCDGFNVCRWMLKNKDEGLPMPEAEEILDRYKKLIDLKIDRKLPLLFFCSPNKCCS